MGIHVRAAGDHVFLVAGQLPPVFRQAPYNQLRYLSSIGASVDSWVVDVWGGICCRTSMYSLEFWHKTLQWGGEGKLIYLRGRWLNPASWHYTVPNLTSPFHVFGPNSPA